MAYSLKLIAFSYCLLLTALIAELVDHLAVLVVDGDFDRNTAIQAVGGAAQSRVVGGYGHFHAAFPSRSWGTRFQQGEFCR